MSDQLSAITNAVAELDKSSISESELDQHISEMSLPYSTYREARQEMDKKLSAIVQSRNSGHELDPQLVDEANHQLARLQAAHDRAAPQSE
ncbi:MAG TPA: hypothetical protein V6C81_21335 [Planktothrix sp.]|jgi:hypothetical protein